MRNCQYHKGCLMPVWGTDKNTGIGYCRNHQWCRTDLDRRSAIQKHLDANRNKSVDELWLNDEDWWWHDRRQEMTGHCLLCGGHTEKDNDKTYKRSISHLLPKKDNFGGFPSVAEHEHNSIELCHFIKSCHTNFDNGKITWEQIKAYNKEAWSVIREKLLLVLPAVAPHERKNKLYSRLMGLVYDQHQINRTH